MTPEFAIQIVRQALMTAFWLALPLLAVGFVAGIVISLVQIVTSIQDTAFNAIPRLLAFLERSSWRCPGCCKDEFIHCRDSRGPGPLWAVSW